MKVGLSTWSFLTIDLPAAISTIGDAGFEYVELWGEVPHAYHSWVSPRVVIDALSPYDMTVSMHAPFTDLNPASPFQPVKGAVEKTLEEFVHFSASVGAKIVTVHPGSVHNAALVGQSMPSSVGTLKKMIHAAGGRVSINVENQTASHSPYNHPLASTPESLDLMLSEVEGLGFTLDTGHANASGTRPSELAQRFVRHLSEVHLSDNEGGADDHLIPGEGTADLQSVLEVVKGTDTLISLELNPFTYSPKRIVEATSAVESAVRA